jgi:TetR/AcrR family transcriptional regulator
MTHEKTDPAETILEAALETILIDKISGARLRQVAKRACMSQGNLHYYYPAKDDLFQSLLDHLLKTFVQERKTILADHSVQPEEKLRFFFNQQIELIQRAKEVVIFFDFWVQGTKDAKIRKKIQKMYARWREDILSVIEEGVRKGVFSEAKASQMPALLASIMDGASLQYLMDAGSLDLQAYFDTAYEMVMGALSHRPG